MDGDCAPFTRLAQYLRQSDFDVAAIDAPFSIPSEHLHSRTHRDLLELVANIELRGGGPFPSAQDFVDRVVEGMTPVTKKPLPADRRALEAETSKCAFYVVGRPERRRRDDGSLLEIVARGELSHLAVATKRAEVTG